VSLPLSFLFAIVFPSPLVLRWKSMYESGIYSFLVYRLLFLVQPSRVVEIWEQGKKPHVYSGVLYSSRTNVGHTWQYEEEG